MKRLLFIALCSSLLLALLPVHQTAAAQSTAPALDASLPLCLPDAYLNGSQDCLALGPSTFITDLARQGIPYPYVPLVLEKYDTQLTMSPVPYLKISTEAVPLYASVEDAANNNPSKTLAPGTKYLSIEYRVDREDGVYYLLKDGSWVSAATSRASCCVYSGRFTGLVFDENPRTPFGWIVDEARPRTAPDRQSRETGQVLRRETVVPVYATQESQDTTWYMIGPSSWVERRYIRQLVLNTTPPEGVTNGRWIEVNLYEQTLSVYEDGQLKFATLISSGSHPMYTRPGLFQVREAFERGPMTGLGGTEEYYYLQDVPYTLYFDGARALHGAYWRTLFGYPASHGCVNLSIGDSHWVFDWAKVGDWVYVHDPSGQTPTDPAYYGEGGA